MQTGSVIILSTRFDAECLNRPRSS